MKLKEYETYCPYCQRIIVASNIEEVENGEDNCYMFLHDEGVNHPSGWMPDETMH